MIGVNIKFAKVSMGKFYKYYFLSHCSCLISDFAEPLQLGGAQKKTEQVAVNEEGVVMIQSMGFTRDQAIKALKATVSSHVKSVFSYAFDVLEFSSQIIFILFYSIGKRSKINT